MPEEPESSPAEGNTRATVLLCDDDEGVRAVVSRMLEQAGYHVALADSAQAAIEQARAVRPSVILMDLTMPGTPGEAAMMSLKARPETRGIPVIVFSGREPSERAADPQQVVDWVQKPVDPKRLLSALERALNLRRGKQ